MAALNMNAQDIVLNNLKNILKKSGLTLTSFAIFCKEKGLSVDKSMFSRLNNGSSLKFDKIDPIIAGVRLLPGYENFSLVDLVNVNFGLHEVGELTAKYAADTYSYNDLEVSFAKMFVDLDQIGWIKVNTELQMKTLTDFAILTLKNAGINVARDNDEAKVSSS